MKKTKLIMMMSFLLFFFGITIAGLVVSDREYSENENRYLAEVPQFHIDTFFAGEFQEDLESYLNDQVWGRDQWITVKTAVQKTTGDTDIGGAYVGKDGYDFEKITPESVDDAIFQRNTKAIADYFDYCKATIEADKLTFMLLPTSGLVLADKLPENAILFDQNAYIDLVAKSMQEYNFVDARQALMENAEEGVYYKTDHHWTSRGAFVAYELWCAETGYEFEGSEAYETEVVTDTFRGSLYSKILDHDSAYDEIVTYTKKDAANDFTITIEEREYNSFYFEEKLETKDKYEYFFGGNYGEVHIANNNKVTEDGERNLLVIKDSFANTFLPLIAEKYDNIYMIDLRYYSGDMTAYLEEKEITEVLVLYNISNFISDKNVFRLSLDL